jgi:3-hydroxyacyl-CoA dehydrogenase
VTDINAVTTLECWDGIAVLTLNSPPVNALSVAVREGLLEGLRRAVGDPAATAIVLVCAGRTFIAGADISELGTSSGATLSSIQDLIEASPKPVIAALHGTALGGGLELALCAHYRLAVPSTRLGLPEVKLGLLPGAGGTQRLPRMVGPEKALGSSPPANRWRPSTLWRWAWSMNWRLKKGCARPPWRLPDAS